MAVATGYQQSPTTTASYTINLPTAATPVFSLPSGTYTSVQSVSISDATSGATIYYTTDGSIPTTASVKYSSAISVSAAETLQAIAVATGYIQSTVASATYTVSLPKATLTLSASPNPQGVGEAVVITANVTVVNSQASTAGTFNIVADGNTICSGTTNTPTGYSCSVTTLAQGTHNLSATYIGTYNGGLQANAGPISIVIMPVSAHADLDLLRQPKLALPHSKVTIGSSFLVIQTLSQRLSLDTRQMAACAVMQFFWNNCSRNGLRRHGS